MRATKRVRTSSAAENLITQISDGLAPLFNQMEWAESEIAKAQVRHRRHRNVLHHTFSLLSSAHSRMRQEFVYRSHCRELLERVVAGRCTKQGTAAEVAVALLTTSLAAPLNSTAFGLYCRMWKQAEFPDIDALTDNTVHYEAIGSTQIDDLEVWSRKKLAVPTRILTNIECRGLHHGEPVNCEYAKPSSIRRAA
ncbi:hypothetical protein OHB12_05220 [Nocardia sp. NBC_01730]|uniref:hypothetical protein n=1 Tax=Nocardia sp. NBC_01730 TaxID=2975998 RepID=UPI002E0FFBFF|nr:hypothetical protein OHB12_05220 [Nocardia sp. NBC_01730]